jgi:plasmid stabilization system protein ParE
MDYTVRSLPRAEFDAQHIYDWLLARSAQGARNWWAAFGDACDRLKEDPLTCARSLESDALRRDLREALFKTRRGHYYRLVFMVVESEVRILRVRGPGQPVLTEDELV